MRIQFLILAFMFSVTSAFSDGPQNDIETNRYTGGPKLVFQLTQDQINFLELEQTSFEDALLVLTLEQQEAIFNEWEIRLTKVNVWETRLGRWDCSCHAANAAFRFAEDSIEIGKEFVTTDEYAMKVWSGEAMLPEPVPE